MVVPRHSASASAYECLERPQVGIAAFAPIWVDGPGSRLDNVVVTAARGELAVAARAARREHEGLLVLDRSCVKGQPATRTIQGQAGHESA